MLILDSELIIFVLAITSNVPSFELVSSYTRGLKGT